MPNDAMARQAIREIIENWAIWRDSGDWDRFRSLWHDDGVMVATVFQGSVDEFIDRARRSHERGVTAQHILGGTSVDVNGDRAVAQTRATIGQRAPVHDVVCDVVCTVRFYSPASQAAPVAYKASTSGPVRPGISVLTVKPAFVCR